MASILPVRLRLNRVSRVARYGRVVAREGSADELAKRLLAAADDLAGDAGCELYLVNREVDKPNVIWVTELWRSTEDLAAALEKIKGSKDVEAVLGLVEDYQMIELDLLGGKGPSSGEA
jgi:quinol monooxygenase YgiN